MISLIIIIALLNTALGFVMAVYVLPPSQLPIPRFKPPKISLLRARHQPHPDPTSLLEGGSLADEIPIETAADTIGDSSLEKAQDEVDQSPAEKVPELPTLEPVESGPESFPESDDSAESSEQGESIPAEDDVHDLLDGRISAEPIESIDQIPQEWLSTLDEYGIEAAGLVEVSAHVLRLEVGDYRDRIVRVDNELRKMEGRLKAEQLQKSIDELRQINQTWLTKQAESANHLGSRIDTLSGHQATSSLLLDILENQQARIETLFSNLAELDVNGDPATCERRIFTEIRQLLDLAHLLRDRMFEMLLIIKKTANQLAEINHSMTIDKLTNLPNRAGMEKMFYELFLSDPSRSRQVSCGLMDLDRFTRLMDQYGPDVCDRILRAVGILLDSLLRKNRGFDRIARFDGQRFLLLMADTGPRGAMSAMERFRQTLEKTKFDLADQIIKVTAQCGVAELGPTETMESFFGRLEAATEAAKREGRNCTALDEGHGPKKVIPPNYHIRGRVMML
ncbi:MAG: GGDEF domain-containing protein [Pirellulales bacterium]|nr:GGDEF domain-containing protein [Pirellulales bacterium]